MKNKNILIIGIVILLLVVIGTLLYFLVIKDQPIDKKNKLKEVGIELYTELFYKQLKANYNDVKDVEKYLKKYEEIGIKFNLSEVKKFLEPRRKEAEMKKFIDAFATCDSNKTMVIVYPKSPFGEKDYDVKTILSCE